MNPKNIWPHLTFYTNILHKVTLFWMQRDTCKVEEKQEADLGRESDLFSLFEILYMIERRIEKENLEQ